MRSFFMITRLFSSTSADIPKKRNIPYIKYTILALGGTAVVSLGYQFYKLFDAAPTCPNFKRNQLITDQPFFCTALLRNADKQCSGKKSMEQIGAATGINFKLIQKDLSTQVRLNDDQLIGRNIFNGNYAADYFETLGDLIVKLQLYKDQQYFVNLLTNKICYDIFVCPECHSTMTRQMISATSYLSKADLLEHKVDVKEVKL